MARESIRILGVDTSMRSTGVGVLSTDGMHSRGIAFGLIKNPAARPHSECLDNLYRSIITWIEEHKPETVAVEGVFHCKNVKTAIILGQARGAVLAACAARGLPVYEYSPRSVKQSVVGVGSASKDQVGKMIRSLLALEETPPEDAADALAIALSHANQVRHLDLMKDKRI